MQLVRNGMLVPADAVGHGYAVADPARRNARYSMKRLGSGGRLVNAMYDRQHVDSVLKRVGVPQDRRNAILDKIQFPIDLNALQAFLEPLGITYDALINRMGGSP